MQRAVEGAINEHKIPLHAYINCAGVEGQHGPIEALDVGSFDATLAINLRGTFLGIKHAARSGTTWGCSLPAPRGATSRMHASAVLTICIRLVAGP